ncbi:MULTISPECIES: hypothetical protein [Comamonas]|uniref:hypothetical protein n=1 Tax=Comamonas TaxID=283 RepID=UPI00257C62E1|nr:MULTISPECIES: hypothetical protein [Comamonas]
MIMPSLFAAKNEKRKKLQTRFIPLVSFSATLAKLAYFLCNSVTRARQSLCQTPAAGRWHF